MTKRIAISLSDELFRKIERVRKSRRVARSTLIQEAVGEYVESRDEAELERQYFEGYRRMPDDDEEFRAFARAGIEALAKRGD